MLSEEQRRKATSLSIVLIVFFVFVNFSQAMDSVSGEEENAEVTNTSSSVSASVILENDLLMGFINNPMVSQNALNETELLKNFFNSELQNLEKIEDLSAREKFSKMFYWENEVAETEKTDSQVVYDLREIPRDEIMAQKIASKPSTLEDTSSENSVEDVKSVENIDNALRGEMFFYTTACDFTEEDVEYLARGINGEAGNQPVMEQYRVGNVMVNRKKDQTGRFPQNTIKGILFASGQFGCIHGSGFHHPTEEQKQIARELLEGKCVFPDDVVWFNNTWDYGFYYCKPGFHYFSSYLDHNGDDLVANAKIEKPKVANQQVQQVETSDLEEEPITEDNSEMVEESNEEIENEEEPVEELVTTE